MVNDIWGGRGGISLIFGGKADDESKICVGGGVGGGVDGRTDEEAIEVDVDKGSEVGVDRVSEVERDSAAAGGSKPFGPIGRFPA